MNVIINHIKEFLFKEQSQWPLWYIVFFILGILFYFKFLNTDYTYAFLLIFAGIALAYIYYKSPVLLPVMFLVLGTSAASLRTEYVNTKTISRPMYAVWVKAKVSEVSCKADGKSILITTSNRLSKKRGVYNKLRVVSTNPNPLIKSGDYINFKATIIPSKKAKNSNFDFSRYDYYKGISGTAFTRTKIKILKKGDNTQDLYDSLNNFRKNISKNIIQFLGVKTGSLASALIVGEKSMIPKQENEQIRVSGLSHVFAVSGMHLSLIAAIIFFTTRYSLSFFLNISQKYNTKKLAAFVAIVATLFYLFATGIQVSAVRAFFMILLFMTAIIFDLQPDLKRAIAAAAFIMLLFYPEFILQPGFQLSFIATLSLIAVFEIFKNKFYLLRINRIVLYLLGTTISSFVATIATSMFVLYHFQFVSSYAVLANLVVGPIISFIIMPFVVIYFLLLLTGFSNIALIPINLGLDTLLEITTWVNNLSHSKVMLSIFNDLNLFIFTLGAFWFCLWTQKARYIGLLVVAVSFMI
ncbi:MAG: ComEC/Rec2 family competence protein [Rickettsiales bacterium]